MAERTAERGDGKERERALDLAIAQIEKLYGKGSIMRMGSSGALVPIAAISTGSLELDAALGVGGYRGAASSRSSGRNRPGRRHWPCILSLKLSG